LHFGIQENGQENNGMNGYIDPEPHFGEVVPVLTPPAPVGRTYWVKRGDTLYGIAQAFYGNGNLWPRIYEANKNKITNPRLILTNWVLQIP
jgi:nucleoid-associated protein YgaU